MALWHPHRGSRRSLPPEKKVGSPLSPTRVNSVSAPRRSNGTGSPCFSEDAAARTSPALVKLPG